MEVRTTRPRGKTMRTRGLIRVEWQGSHGRVVWGRVGARALFTIGKLDEASLTWQSSRSKPFHWDRQEAWCDEDEPEAEESGSAELSDSNGEDEWADDKWAEEAWAESASYSEEAWPDWYNGASDMAKRRAQLRRTFRESRQQLSKQASTWKAPGKKWNKSEKSAASKPTPNWSEEETRDDSVQILTTEQRLTDAAATTEALKSLLGINTRMNDHADRTPAAEVKQDASAGNDDDNDGVPEVIREPEPVPATQSADCASGAALFQGSGRLGCGTVEKTNERDATLPTQISGQSVASVPRDKEQSVCMLPLLPLSSLTGIVAGQPQVGPESKHGCDVGERLLSELCTGVSGKASNPNGCANAASVQVNRLEHVVQGFLGQPWFTPAWSMSNNSGWAFDLQWVTSTLEWYFSDMNLCGDPYLRSLMMPKEGWVPLMLLLAFPRLQALGVDCVVLGQAAMCSATLELDSTAYYTRIRDKARRTQWLPVR